jgi:FKBP-type peptidyl-prolyl cis-trans isomerase FkpA
MNFKFLITCLLCIGCVQFTYGQQDFKRSPKGAFYKIFKPHTGPRIKLNDVISFHAIQKTEKDSVLFSSYETGRPIKIQVVPSYNLGDLMDVFPLLAEGDSALVKVPADSLFRNYEDQRPDFLPSGSFLYFAVKIQRVQTLDEALDEKKAHEEKLMIEELVALDKYIAASKYPFENAANGLKYQLLRNTTNKRPLPGDTVMVNYTGRLIDGKVFDSSIEEEAKKAGLVQPGRSYGPFQFVIGQGQVIQGWDEGLLLLREGAMAQFVIPSSLAYGGNAMGTDIKPYSTLIFDVEMVKVKPLKRETDEAVDNKGNAPKTQQPAQKTSILKKK